MGSVLNDIRAFPFRYPNNILRCYIVQSTEEMPLCITDYVAFMENVGRCYVINKMCRKVSQNVPFQLLLQCFPQETANWRRVYGALGKVVWLRTILIHSLMILHKTHAPLGKHVSAFQDMKSLRAFLVNSYKRCRSEF